MATGERAAPVTQEQGAAEPGGDQAAEDPERIVDILRPAVLDL